MMADKTPQSYRSNHLDISSDDDSDDDTDAETFSILSDMSNESNNLFAPQRTNKVRDSTGISALSNAVKAFSLDDGTSDDEEVQVEDEHESPISLNNKKKKNKQQQQTITFFNSSDDEGDDQKVRFSIRNFNQHSQEGLLKDCDDSSVESTATNSSDCTDSSEEDDDSTSSSQTLDFRWKRSQGKKEYIVISKSGADMPGLRIPATMFSTLYQHQKEGVAWMAGLYNQEIGGLLADDMGMGKTYQTLTLLGGLFRAKTIRNALVLAPLSVLESWEYEAREVFTICSPNVHIQVIHGDVSRGARYRHLHEALTCSSARPRLIISSYGLIGSSHTDFIKEGSKWDYIVLDEAHLIKNAKAIKSINIRKVAQPEGTRKLLLTGTPIMNNLNELWALFDFVASGRLLGTEKWFNATFRKPIENARNKDATEQQRKASKKATEDLQTTIRPFILQRLKSDCLADELPDRKHVVIWTHLSPIQRKWYAQYVGSKDGTVADVLSGIKSSPLVAISWLTKLCGHPILVDKREYQKFVIGKIKREELIALSSKLQVLDALVTHLKKNGHRTLIFSRSTKTLDVIQRVIQNIGGIRRIDGKTKQKDRQKLVDEFNAENSKIDIMLLSTKAAGMGLTLTGADRAIIYDPSWNPGDDSQAVERCYRIKQTKPVTFFRLIAAGTVEEKMYEKQVHKDGIKNNIVTKMGNGTARYFGKYELGQVFRLNEPGECDFLKRLRDKKLMTGNGNKGFLPVDIVGTSFHEMLYTEATTEFAPEEDPESDDEQADSPQQNPFASPVKGKSVIAPCNYPKVQQFEGREKLEAGTPGKDFEKTSERKNRRTSGRALGQQHPFASPTKVPAAIKLFASPEARDPQEKKADECSIGELPETPKRECSEIPEISQRNNCNEKPQNKTPNRDSQVYFATVIALAHMKEGEGSLEDAMYILTEALNDKSHVLSKVEELTIRRFMSDISDRLDDKGL